MKRDKSKHTDVPTAINIGEADAGPVPDDSAENAKPAPQKEIDGRDGPDPTRFGDWEKAGRCIDF